MAVLAAPHSGTKDDNSDPFLKAQFFLSTYWGVPSRVSSNLGVPHPLRTVLHAGKDPVVLWNKFS